MKVYIAGIGMEGIQTLTVQAEKAIESSDLLIGSKRVLEPFCKYGKKFVEEWRAEEIRKILLQSSCDTVTVLFSGDVGFYSGASKLIHELKEFDTEIISGISSPVYFSSKTGIPWQNMKFISEFLKMFTYITTGTAVAFAVYTLIVGYDMVYAYTVAEIPLVGLIMSFVTTATIQHEYSTNKGMILAFVCHYIFVSISLWY